MSERFQRLELLLGKEVIERFAQVKVIQFGVGGVGSWCLESLVRTGFQHITIVDFDDIVESNINRQLPATTKTIGQKKADVLAQRMREINPDVQIIVRNEMYSPDNANTFPLAEYDVIIDCIDTMQCKMHLIRQATKTDAFFISSMGAALKTDVQQIRVDEFWDVQYDLFARSLRKSIRKGELPSKSFPCVYSTEQSEHESVLLEIDGVKKRVNGSLAHVTAAFGFTIAGEVCKHFVEICKK